MSTLARYELKYILYETEFCMAQNWLNGSTVARMRYADRNVNSLYFDDLEFTSVRDNLAGIADRRKVRLRWYGGGGDLATGARLEIKRRVGRLSYKDIVTPESFSTKVLQSCPSKIAARLWKSLPADQMRQVNYGNMYPLLHVSYLRKYFEDPFGLRVTFDSNIEYRVTNPTRKLLDSSAICFPQRIMEVKFPQSERPRAVELLRKLNLAPKRHSKFLMGLSMHGQAVYI